MSHKYNYNKCFRTVRYKEIERAGDGNAFSAVSSPTLVHFSPLCRWDAFEDQAYQAFLCHLKERTRNSHLFLLPISFVITDKFY